MPGLGGLSQTAAPSPLPGRTSVAERYRRAAEPVLRGMTGVAVTVGLFAVAGAVTPGGSLAWYRVGVQTAGFVVVLAAGYGLEQVVAARTGWRSLGSGGGRAEDR